MNRNHSLPPRRGNFIDVVKQPDRLSSKILSESSLQTKNKMHIFVAVCLCVLAALIISGYLIFFNKSSGNEGQNLNDVSVIKDKVGRHYLLPKAEMPALATVTDPSKLTTEFLRQAKSGDKLLIYQEAKVVIIYRPSVDRIVNVGPVQIAELKNE